MMENLSFPSEMRAFAKIEKALQKEDLSLQQIEKIGEKILDATTEKTQGLSQGLLNRLEEKRDKVLQERMQKLEKTTNPLKRIEGLRELMYFLPPDEIEAQFSAIAMQAALLPTQDQKTKEAAGRQLEHFAFQMANPVLHELDETTPHSFQERVQKIAKAIQKTESLKPLEGFNALQLKQIFGRGA